MKPALIDATTVERIRISDKDNKNRTILYMHGKAYMANSKAHLQLRKIDLDYFNFIYTFFHQIFQVPQ